MRDVSTSILSACALTLQSTDANNVCWSSSRSISLCPPPANAVNPPGDIGECFLPLCRAMVAVPYPMGPSSQGVPMKKKKKKKKNRWQNQLPNLYARESDSCVPPRDHLDHPPLFSTPSFVHPVTPSLTSPWSSRGTTKRLTREEKKRIEKSNPATPMPLAFATV